MATLGDLLQQPIHELKFGTSGRRGLVCEMSQLEIYTNARAEIEYLQRLPLEKGGITPGDEFYYAADLRPSSVCFVEEFGGRGEIAQAIETAIHDAGMKPVFLGFLPTPALTFFALQRRRASIMVTGSHIPFERNGYKTNTSLGELLKEHERPINQAVALMRERLLNQSAEDSQFDANGRLKCGHKALPAVLETAREEYKNRYLRFFSADALKGMRLVCYQHSAVGRDLLVEILEALGAEVHPMGRSERFVPIDTENIDAACLADLNRMLAEATAKFGRIDALVSTDGDSDRPLVVGVDGQSQAQFFNGDRLGMVVAEFLGADAVVVPISANDGIDRSALAPVLEPRTRIGSPFVIAGMEAAQQRGKQKVCGWEANGGFLLGSECSRQGKKLAALATRDAMLPILAALTSAREKELSLCQLFAALPARFGDAALIRNFPRSRALEIVRRFSPAEPSVVELSLADGELTTRHSDGHAELLTPEAGLIYRQIFTQLEGYFAPLLGNVVGLNWIDGLRIRFDGGEVAHIRPSGNADELRIYAMADDPARAKAITAAGIAEPDGILRRMEADL